MAIRHRPSDERPREKLLDKGAAALSDAELLAILLRTGTPGRSALDVARDVLASFHSLRKLIAADRKRFCAERGLGSARFAELQAAIEIARRQMSETLRAGPSLASPRATRDFLSTQLRDLEHEVFCCLYLDLCGADSYVERAPQPPVILDFAASALNINCGSGRYTADAECNYADFRKACCAGPQKAYGGRHTANTCR